MVGSALAVRHRLAYWLGWHLGWIIGRFGMWYLVAAVGGVGVGVFLVWLRVVTMKTCL